MLHARTYIISTNKHVFITMFYIMTLNPDSTFSLYTSGVQSWSSGATILHVLDVSLLQHT